MTSASRSRATVSLNGAGRQRRPGHGEADVDLALFHPSQDVAPDRREGEIDAGRLALEPGDEAGRDQDRLGVGGGQTEGPLQPRRIDRRRTEEPAQAFERRRHLGLQRFGGRRRREAAADPDEQRIAENLAQPRQRPAHRRLAQAHLGRRPGDVAQPKQRLQRGKEIEIESG